MLPISTAPPLVPSVWGSSESLMLVNATTEGIWRGGGEQITCLYTQHTDLFSFKVIISQRSVLWGYSLNPG